MRPTGGPNLSRRCPVALDRRPLRQRALALQREGPDLRRTDGDRPRRLSSELANKTTSGLDVRTGHRVFKLSSGAFNPAISDGQRLFVTGYSSIFGLEPRALARKRLREERRERRERRERERKKREEKEEK